MSLCRWQKLFPLSKATDGKIDQLRWCPEKGSLCIFGQLAPQHSAQQQHRKMTPKSITTMTVLLCSAINVTTLCMTLIKMTQYFKIQCKDTHPLCRVSLFWMSWRHFFFSGFCQPRKKYFKRFSTQLLSCVCSARLSGQKRMLRC